MVTTSRGYHLKSKFGITEEQYEDLLEKQEYRCFICHRDQSVFSRKLAVDHNHKTREIRGILCYRCNQGLKYFADDPDYFLRAAQYVNNKTGWFVPKKKRKKTQKKEKL